MTEQESSAETREQVQKESVPQNGAQASSKPETKIEPTPAPSTPIPTRSPATPVAAEPNLVRRRALVRCKGVLCVPGKPEIVTFQVGRDFWPERIVLHHLCVRGLLISDIRVRREGSTDAGVSKLDGEGELIGEAFIASIAENHTPDLGKIEKHGAVDLHVKNVAPTPAMVHGHIHGFVLVPSTD
jgi:hypothetical protein